MSRKLLFALGLGALALTLAAPAPAGRPLVVDDDQAQCRNAQYTTIQAAVNAAQAGDRIEVCAGTYAEEVMIATSAKNGLRLHARGRRGAVVLDGQNTMMNGFRLENVTGVLIEGFAVRRYHDNIWLENADHNEIRRNRTSEAWDHDGIVVTNGSDENNVHHNVAFNNTRPIGCGMSVGGGSRDNRFHHNRTFGNQNAGILLGGGILGPAGPGNVIAHNKVTDNPGHGIFDANSPGSRIRHNYVRHNGFRSDRPGHGIFLTGAATTGVVVAYNRILRSTVDGISLASADTNTLARNHSRANGRDGIRVDAASDGNVIRRNHMRRNAEHDAHDENRPANTWTRNHCRTDFPAGTIC